jgi:hypothetical protein
MLSICSQADHVCQLTILRQELCPPQIVIRLIHRAARRNTMKEKLEFS